MSYVKRWSVQLSSTVKRIPVSVQFTISSVFLFHYVQTNFEYYSYNPFFTLLLDLNLDQLFRVVDPVDFSLRLLLNLLILYALHALFYALTARSQTAILLTVGLVLFLHQANHAKFIHLRDAISVQNLLYLHQIPEVIKHGYRPGMNVIMGAIIVLFTLSVWSVIQRRFERLPRHQRLRWAALAVSILGIFFIPGINDAAEKLFRLEQHYYSAALSMKDNGFFAALASDVRRTVNQKKARKPAHYSEEEIARILAPYRGQAPKGKKEPVRIVIYLMESFWDPTRFPELGLKKDPIREFHQLQQESAYFGEIYSPTFGGFTVQAEFEILTGMSAHLAHDTAYRTIDTPAFSLASYLKDIRPTTNLFVTAHNAWFWDRSRILPRLGFDVLKEQTDFTCRDLKGDWNCPSESCLIRETLGFMKTEWKRGQSSVILINGVQNHGPYEKPYVDRDFKITGNLSSQDKIRLQNNLNHLADLSAALKQLIKAFKNSKDRVVVVAFGDHLPGGYDFYASQTDEKLHRTPFLIWTNRPASRKKVELIGANYLSGLALEVSGLETLPVHRYMKALSRRIPVITPELAARAKEELLREETGAPTSADREARLLRDFALIQYDLLYGEGYARKKR
jgi:phosphoglycerol transferase MdoB-like AlkP superfamily enzyme